MFTFLIIFSFIIIITVQILVFVGILHWLAKFFKVENSNFRTTLKIILIYFAVSIPSEILVIAIGIYGLRDPSAISNTIFAVFVFLFLLAIFIFYYLFYWLFKRYYHTHWKIFIKIFALFVLFMIVYNYFIVGPTTDYIRSNLFEPILIKSKSMEPTFLINDYLIVKKFKNKYQRGDAVFVKKSAIDIKEDFIKRIIALPDEHIQIKDGVVLINGQKLIEIYGNGGMVENADLALGSDEYFILGDNRGKSYDSRDFGPIKKEDILGKVIWGFRLKEFKILKQLISKISEKEMEYQKQFQPINISNYREDVLKIEDSKISVIFPEKWGKLTQYQDSILKDSSLGKYSKIYFSKYPYKDYFRYLYPQEENDNKEAYIALYKYPENFIDDANIDDAFYAFTKKEKEIMIAPLLKIYKERQIDNFLIDNPLYGEWWGNLGAFQHRISPKYIENINNDLRGVAYFVNEAQDAAFVPDYRVVLINPEHRLIIVLNFELGTVPEIYTIAKQINEATDNLEDDSERNRLEKIGYGFLKNLDNQKNGELGLLLQNIESIIQLLKLSIN